MLPLKAALFAVSVVIAPSQAQLDSVTLDEALARAHTIRPKLRAAGADIDRAHGAQRVAGLVPNPMAQYEDNHASDSRKATLVQPLGWIARRWSDVAAGRADVERARSDSSQAAADVGRDVRLAFFTAVAARELLRLAGEQQSIADSLVSVAERRLAAGDISALDRDQVAHEAKRARVAALRAAEDVTIAEHALARAVGLAGTSSLVARGVLADGLSARSPPEVSAVGESAPAIRSMQLDSAAAASRLRSTQIARVPLPSLLAGMEWRSLDPQADRLILGFTLPLPLWSWGQQQVHEARGNADGAAARAAEARLDIEARITAARLRVAAGAERAWLMQETMLAEAQRLRASAVRLYDEGRTGVLPVFEALRAERDTARDTVLELLAWQHARADLLGLLGRWK